MSNDQVSHLLKIASNQFYRPTIFFFNNRQICHMYFRLFLLVKKISSIYWRKYCFRKKLHTLKYKNKSHTIWRLFVICITFSKVFFKYKISRSLHKQWISKWNSFLFSQYGPLRYFALLNLQEILHPSTIPPIMTYIFVHKVCLEFSYVLICCM